MTTLAKVKLLLNITDESKDALLTELIDNAEEYVVNFTRNAGCLDSLQGTVVDMVIFDYNRLGSEGLKTENYSGVSYGYVESYGEDIMKQLKRFRKVGVI